MDVSILGIEPSDLEEMDADERQEELIDALNRAVDIMQAVTKAFEKDLSTGQTSTISQAARNLVQITRQLGR